MTDTEHSPVIIRVEAWPDPVIDTLGFDPRSRYVEMFWLPTLGPTSLLLLRQLAHRFAVEGDTLSLPLATTAQSLGLGPRESKNSPLVRSLTRLTQFNLAIARSEGVIAVRRTLPPISGRHIRRLPARLRTLHDEWKTKAPGVKEMTVERAQQVAVALRAAGVEPRLVEHQLADIGFPGPICRDAAAFAAHALGPDEATGSANPAPPGRDDRSGAVRTVGEVRSHRTRNAHSAAPKGEGA